MSSGVNKSWSDLSLTHCIKWTPGTTLGKKQVLLRPIEEMHGNSGNSSAYNENDPTCLLGVLPWYWIMFSHISKVYWPEVDWKSKALITFSYRSLPVSREMIEFQPFFFKCYYVVSERDPFFMVSFILLIQLHLLEHKYLTHYIRHSVFSTFQEQSLWNSLVLNKYIYVGSFCILNFCPCFRSFLWLNIILYYEYATFFLISAVGHLGYFNFFGYCW